MRKGRQTDLGSALGGMLKRLDRGTGGAYRQMAVKQAWASLAGESVLAHTTGAFVRERELVVFVDSNVWATELSALSGRYLHELEKELGKGVVTSIRFTVSRKVAEEQRIERMEKEAEEERSADVVASVPLSELERAQVEASVAEIPDEELRQAVLRATVADLEWKKGLKQAK